MCAVLVILHICLNLRLKGQKTHLTHIQKRSIRGYYKGTFATVGIFMTHYIKVSAPDEIYEILKNYANCLGSTPSTVLRELLIEISPSLQGVVNALSSFDTDKKNALIKVQDVLLDGILGATNISLAIQKGIQQQ